MLTHSRIPLGRAHMLASAVIQDVARSGLRFDGVTPLGSLRRFAPDIGDVSLMAVAPLESHDALLDGLSRLPIFVRVVDRGSQQLTADTERGPVTVYLVAPQHAGAALVWHTGSRRHTQALQERARARGLTFEHGQLIGSDGAALPTASEEAFYQLLGLPVIPPELREGTDEFESADAGRLPSLITELDIRGDLHMHSTWSDGRNPIGEMVAASQQLGYEYVAITDHSERSLASRKLAASDIGRQRKEIDRIRKRMPRIQILHGIEVDIMPDGTLDFPDDVLESFDIVLASLHDHAGHDTQQLTERYLRAIANPLVNVITHPANRSPARFAGYELDYDRMFAAAAESGTAMEIDGAPGHLDMDGEVARRAIAVGVTVTIDSDCHRADALSRQMRFGVGTARRGWIEPAHVLNTRPVEEVRAFVARKRARR